MNKDILPDDAPEKKEIPNEQDSSPSLPNPFNLANLVLKGDFGSTVGVKKVFTTIACRKPHRQTFVQVRKGDEWRLPTAIFHDEISRENYLVSRELWEGLGNEVFPVCLVLAITRQGDPFLWPLKMPRGDGSSNSWNESALAAANVAEDNWVRVSSNNSTSQYDTFVATAEFPEPEWPELTFQELIELCFRDRYIADMGHPILRALRGEV
jgi:hypothetical protein